MNKLYDALEACLAGLEQGRSLHEVLREFPDLADELKVVLDSALRAQGLKTDGPARDVIERGRRKLLQQTAQMRTRQYTMPRDGRRLIYRLAGSIALAILFFIGGTGMVRAASHALPGDDLYPVKRNWESVRLFLTFDPTQRLALAGEFEEERIVEVDNLLTHGYTHQVNFSGIFRKNKSASYVSGIQIQITSTTLIPHEELFDGMAVIVTGRTDAGGFVEAIRIELLPKGTIVPLGNSDELEIDPGESEAPQMPSGQQASELEIQGDNGLTADSEERIEFHLEGIIKSIQGATWVVNDKKVYVQNARITGLVIPGAEVEIFGFFAEDGKFMVTEVVVDDEGEDKQGTDIDSNTESQTLDDLADDDGGGGDGDSEDGRSGDSSDGGDPEP